MPPGSKKKKKQRDKSRHENGRNSVGDERCRGHTAKNVHSKQLRKVQHGSGPKNWTCIVCKKKKIEKSEIENECQICLKCCAPFCCNDDRETHVQTVRSDPHTLYFNISARTIWCTLCKTTLTKDSDKKLFEALGDPSLNYLSNISVTSFKTEKTNTPIVFDNEIATPRNFKTNMESKNPHAAAGLMNCGNSCYANSVLQCLARTPGLYQSIKDEISGPKSIKLKNGDTLEIDSIVPDDIINDYLNIHEYLNEADHRKTKISAACLLKKLQLKDQHFDWKEQHDAHEFLRLLLDLLKTTIHESKNMEDIKSRRTITPELRQEIKALNNAVCEVKNFGPDNIFGGKIVNTLTCKVCHLETERSEVFMDISLPVIKQECDSPIKGKQFDSKIPLHNATKKRKAKLKGINTQEDVAAENGKNSVDCVLNENISKSGLECEEDQVVPSLEKNELVDDLEECLKNITLGLEDDKMSDDDIPALETPVFDDKVNSCTQLILYEGRLNGGYEEHFSTNENVEEFSEDKEKYIIEDINGNIDGRLLDENQNMMTEASRCNELKSLNDLSQELNFNFPAVQTNSSIWFHPLDLSDIDTWLIHDFQSEKKYCFNRHCPKFINETQILIDHRTDPNNVSRIVLNLGNSMKTTKEIGIHNVKPETYLSPYNEKDNETPCASNYLNTIEEENSDDIRERIYGPKSNSPVDDIQISPLFDEISNLPPLTDEETKIINDHEMEFDSSLSIYSCLKQFTDLELLTGSNKVACDNCTKRSTDSKAVYTERIKTLSISKAPEALILHLKRFQLVKRDVKKVKQHVKFTTILDFTPFCLKDNGGNKLYRLYGVVEHSGTISSGHYVCYIAKFDDDKVTSQSNANWYYASDSKVMSVTESKVLQTQAYLLFYRRIAI